MKMEQIECSEMSAYINQTPGNYPKENTLYSEQCESLKSSSNDCHCLTLRRFSVVAFSIFICSHLLLTLLFPFHVLHRSLLLIVLLVFLDPCVCNSVILLLSCLFAFSLQCHVMILLDIPFFCSIFSCSLMLTCLSGYCCQNYISAVSVFLCYFLLLCVIH